MNKCNIFLIGSFFAFISIDIKLYRLIIVLLLLQGIYIFIRRKISVPSYVGNLIFINLIYFASFLIMIFTDDNFRIRDIDHASRFLLYLPVAIAILSINNINLVKIFKVSILISFIYIISNRIFCHDILIDSSITISQILLVMGSFIYYTSISSRNIFSLNYIFYLISLLSIVMLNSRGVILAILPIIIAINIVNYKIINGENFHVKKVLLTSVFLMFMMYFENNSFQRIKTGYNTVKSNILTNNIAVPENSVAFRWKYLQKGYESFISSPIFGVGRSTSYMQASKININSSNEKFSHHHNEYISALADRGILGFVVLMFYLLYFMFFFFKSLLYNSNEYAMFGLILIFSYILFFLTDSPLIGSMRSVDFFVFSVIIIYILINNKVSKNNAKLFNHNTNL